MNLEILAEYIREEWASDFGYAHYDDTPWTPFHKESAAACVALVTTAGVHLRHDPPFTGVDDTSYRQIPATALEQDLTLSHPLFETAEMEQDLNALFPLTRLRELQHDGLIGQLASQHFSFMGLVPHWRPLEEQAKDVGARLRSAGVDAAILTPGSPLCHHSLGIVQRRIEEAGIATIALTSEPEISRLVKVPRAMVVGFPPGCPVGEPGDAEKQRKVLQEAIEYLITMTEPGAVWRSPFKWTQSCSAPVCKL